MLLQITIFLTLFLLLYLLGRKITRFVHNTSLLLTKNKKISLAVLLIFLLPGTIIHELSHFIIAAILFVPVGKITIIPKIEKGIVKAGSVHHADTDIIRHTLIGLAPIIIGLILIYFIGGLFLNSFIIHNSYFIIQKAVTLYLLFAISLSMFSSKKDLETTWFLAPVLIITILSLYIAGLRLSTTADLQNATTHFLSQLNTYLFITTTINIIVFFVLKGIILSLEKILKRKVVSFKE